jgi:hypothetical protein
MVYANTGLIAKENILLPFDFSETEITYPRGDML